MVLSNKKLKQKLRSLLADSISASESVSTTNNKKPSTSSSSLLPDDGDVKKQVESIRELLGSKPNLPKRERRRNKKPPPPSSEDPKPLVDTKGTENGNEEDENKKKKNKKRKRDGDGDGEEDNVSIEKNKKNKNKKKNKKKKEKKKKEKKDKKEEKINKEDKDTEKGVEEAIRINESEVKKVYVGGIPYYSTEDDIRSFFEGCGTITEIDCMRFPETGKFRGIAILSFKTEAAAKRALALDGADMGGFYLKIQPYKVKRNPKSDFAPEIVDGYNRAYVGNLSWDITEDDLKKFFSDCKVSAIRFGMDKETGEFKGYAHVDFPDSVSLSIALKLDQQIVCGRPARISCAVPKKAGETTKAIKKADENKREDGPSTFQNKEREAIEAIKKPDDNKGEAGQSTGTSKKKRRTCYECGIPGHISSECPKKKAAEADGSDVKS